MASAERFKQQASRNRSNAAADRGNGGRGRYNGRGRGWRSSDVMAKHLTRCEDVRRQPQSHTQVVQRAKERELGVARTKDRYAAEGEQRSRTEMQKNGSAPVISTAPENHGASVNPAAPVTSAAPLTSAAPVANVWDSRKQLLEDLTPSSRQEEEDMLEKAMQLSIKESRENLLNGQFYGACYMSADTKEPSSADAACLGVLHDFPVSQSAVNDAPGSTKAGLEFGGNGAGFGGDDAEFGGDGRGCGGSMEHLPDLIECDSAATAEKGHHNRQRNIYDEVTNLLQSFPPEVQFGGKPDDIPHPTTLKLVDSKADDREGRDMARVKAHFEEASVELKEEQPLAEQRLEMARGTDNSAPGPAVISRAFGGARPKTSTYWTKTVRNIHPFNKTKLGEEVSEKENESSKGAGGVETHHIAGIEKTDNGSDVLGFETQRRSDYSFGTAPVCFVSASSRSHSGPSSESLISGASLSGYPDTIPHQFNRNIWSDVGRGEKSGGWESADRLYESNQATPDTPIPANYFHTGSEASIFNSLQHVVKSEPLAPSLGIGFKEDLPNQHHSINLQFDDSIDDSFTTFPFKNHLKGKEIIHLPSREIQRESMKKESEGFQKLQATCDEPSILIDEPERAHVEVSCLSRSVGVVTNSDRSSDTIGDRAQTGTVTVCGDRAQTGTVTVCGDPLPDPVPSDVKILRENGTGSDGGAVLKGPESHGKIPPAFSAGETVASSVPHIPDNSNDNEVSEDGTIENGLELPQVNNNKPYGPVMPTFTYPGYEVPYVVMPGHPGFMYAFYGVPWPSVEEDPDKTASGDGERKSGASASRTKAHDVPTMSHDVTLSDHATPDKAGGSRPHHVGQVPPRMPYATAVRMMAVLPTVLVPGAMPVSGVPLMAVPRAVVAPVSAPRNALGGPVGIERPMPVSSGRVHAVNVPDGALNMPRGTLNAVVPGTSHSTSVPPGTAPSTSVPSGTEPAVSVPPGTEPSTSVPPGNEPSTRVPQGIEPCTNVPPGSMPSMGVPSGPFPNMTGPPGYLPSINVPSGPRPSTSLSSKIPGNGSSTVRSRNVPDVSIPRGRVPNVSAAPGHVSSVNVPQVTALYMGVPMGPAPPPSGTVLSVSIPQGTMPCVNVPPGIIPSVSEPAGSMHSVNVPPGTMPSEGVPPGTILSVSVPSGSIPVNVPVRTVPYMSVAQGTLSIGDVPLGSAAAAHTTRAPAAGAPTAAVPRIPATCVPTASGLRVHHTPTTAVPRIPATCVPTASGLRVHQTPTTAVPRTPATCVPTASGLRVHHIPTTVVPRTPDTCVPTASGLRVHHTPTTAVPRTPATCVPTASGLRVHHTPATVVPLAPITGVPHVSCLGIRNKPAAGVCAAPAIGVPRAPGPGVLLAPGPGVPRVSGPGVPGASGPGVPRASGQGVPRASGQGVPRAPGQGAPWAPGPGVLQAPVQGVPRSPGSAVPLVPGTGVPGASCPAVPLVPAMRTPFFPDQLAMTQNLFYQQHYLACMYRLRNHTLSKDQVYALPEASDVSAGECVADSAHLEEPKQELDIKHEQIERLNPPYAIFAEQLESDYSNLNSGKKVKCPKGVDCLEMRTCGYYHPAWQLGRIYSKSLHRENSSGDG